MLMKYCLLIPLTTILVMVWIACMIDARDINIMASRTGLVASCETSKAHHAFDCIASGERSFSGAFEMVWL